MGGEQQLGQAWWETRYRESRTPWDRCAPSPALGSWLASAEAPRGCILVPGCGRGHEVVELARRGFDVTAVDYAPRALAALREQLQSTGLYADVVQADLLEWEAPRTFDAIYEQTSLCALPPSCWTAYAERLHGWLRAGGSMFALFMQTGRGDGPPFHCNIRQMRALFPEQRWRWPSAPEMEVPHPSGLVEIGYLLQRLP
jgi:SAM-dependent methyltransferase